MGFYRQYQWLCWTVLSVELYVGSLQAVPVVVLDSIVSRTVSGVFTGSTCGCAGQYCQENCT